MVDSKCEIITHAMQSKSVENIATELNVSSHRVLNVLNTYVYYF